MGNHKNALATPSPVAEPSPDPSQGGIFFPVAPKQEIKVWALAPSEHLMLSLSPANPFIQEVHIGKPLKRLGDQNLHTVRLFCEGCTDQSYSHLNIEATEVWTLDSYELCITARNKCQRQAMNSWALASS